MDFPLPCLIAGGYYPTFHSYSIHIPFIFHSYSIHIPFIFHWYSIHITIKSPFLDDFRMISHVVPIWSRSSLQTWAQVRGPVGFNGFKHQRPDMFFSYPFLVKWVHGIFMEYSWNIHGIFMNYSWNIHGIFMKYSWNIHGILINNQFPRAFPGWFS